MRKIPIFLRLEYDYPNFVAHALEINNFFPNLLSCFIFFQSALRETELRITVSGDGKYPVLFYTGCLNKQLPKIIIENIQKLKKKLILRSNFVIFLQTSLTNHWKIS